MQSALPPNVLAVMDAIYAVVRDAMVSGNVNLALQDELFRLYTRCTRIEEETINSLIVPSRRRYRIPEGRTLPSIWQVRREQAYARCAHMSCRVLEADSVYACEVLCSAIYAAVDAGREMRCDGSS